MPDLSKPERTRRRIWLWLYIFCSIWFGIGLLLAGLPIIGAALDRNGYQLFQLDGGVTWERVVVTIAAQSLWTLGALWLLSIVPALTMRRFSRGRAAAPWSIIVCRAMLAAAAICAVSVLLVGVIEKRHPDQLSAMSYDESEPILLMSIAVAVPALAVLLLARLIPTGRDPGQCRACGYDLRGVASDTCPECGAPRPTATASPARPPLTFRRIAYALTIHTLALLGIVVLLDRIWPQGRLEREAVELVKGTEGQLKRLRESRGNTGLREHFYSAALGNDGSIFLLFDKADRLLELRVRPPGAPARWIFTRDIDYPERWVLEVARQELDPQTNTLRTLSSYLDNNADGMPEQLLFAAPHDLRIIIPPIDLDPTELDPTDPDPSDPDPTNPD